MLAHRDFECDVQQLAHQLLEAVFVLRAKGNKAVRGILTKG